jgi:hypothetical protein
MTQIVNNYISQHKTRIRRSKNRWAYIGAAAAICGLLGVYGTSTANAQYDSELEVKCTAIKTNMESALIYWDIFTKSAATHTDSAAALNAAKQAAFNKKQAVEWATIYTAKCK